MDIDNPFKKNSKPWKFFKIANVDEEGFSDWVDIGILQEHGLGFGNGVDWARKSSSIGQKYNVVTKKISGRVVAIKLDGFNKKGRRFSQRINHNIDKKIKKKDCVVLGIHGNFIETDHKDGRKDDYGMHNRQSEDDFQPLHRNVNIAKREHCKECNTTNIRFDAKKLGYSHSQFKGSKEYTGSCIGCYWHDPFRFNEEISINFKKEK